MLKIVVWVADWDASQIYQFLFMYLSCLWCWSDCLIEWSVEECHHRLRLIWDERDRASQMCSLSVCCLQTEYSRHWWLSWWDWYLHAWWCTWVSYMFLSIVESRHDWWISDQLSSSMRVYDWRQNIEYSLSSVESWTVSFFLNMIQFVSNSAQSSHQLMSSTDEHTSC